MTYAPSSKVSVGGLVMLLCAAVLADVKARFGITLLPEESALITAAFGLLAAYLTPHSQPGQPSSAPSPQSEKLPPP